MVDYPKMAKLAQRLIEANGRAVSFVRLSRDPANPSKPWRGDTSKRDPINPDVVQIDDILAVFLEPSSLVRFGIEYLEDEMQQKRVTEILIVADISIAGEDLSTYDEVIDGGNHYNIRLVRSLAPGGTKLFTVIGMNR